MVRTQEAWEAGRPVTLTGDSRKRVGAAAGLVAAALIVSACSGGSVGTEPQLSRPVASGSRPSTLHGAPLTCRSGWQAFPEPFAPGDRQHRLFALGASSADNAWAVGERWVDSPDTSGQVPYPLIEHWDGHGWTVATVGNPSDLPASLFGITVISPTDAWAVGGFRAASRKTRNAPLVEHWNGVRWSLTRVPALAKAGPHQQQALVAVAGVSPNDVWALGNASVAGTSYVNRLLHWNGRAWSRVAAPEPSSPTAANGLGSISLLSAVAIDPSSGSPWAVGGHLRGAGEEGTFHGALIGSWTRRSWIHRPSPATLLPLTAISFPRGRTVWTIQRPSLGSSPDGTRWGGAGSSSVLRDNGMHWDTVLSTHGTLNGLAAITNRDVWLAGTRHGPLLMHWTGASWATVAAPARVVLPHGLFALTVTHDHTLLALGESVGKPKRSKMVLWTHCPTNPSHT
jgi:hypothetical protein